MTTISTRNIIKIDETKCNGCGNCVISCAEGALQIIDGKAKLISDKYCDGLGACLGDCPQGAITIEQRTAEEFDEEATNLHLQKGNRDNLPCDCPSAMVTQFEKPQSQGKLIGKSPVQQSILSHWPVQLTLVPATAPFLQGSDVVLAADCVPFAYPCFHQNFLQNHSLLIACPKLDNYQSHLQKLTEIFKHAAIKSLTVVHMEVPCCSGLVRMAQQAKELSDRDIPIHEVNISIKGDIISG